MKTVAYTCPFVPAEWIAAHGLRPMRIVPRSDSAAASALPAAGVCTYIRAFAGTLCREVDAAAFVVTTRCDGMRRIAEIVERRTGRPTFLLTVPATWQSPAGGRLFRDELERLGRFLIRVGGVPGARERIASVALEFDAARAALRAAGERLPARAFAEAIVAFGRDPYGSVLAPTDEAACVAGAPPGERETARGVPLAVVGGPMWHDDLGMFDIVRDAGGRVVLNATETGERTFPGAFDRRRVREDPLGELVDAYFGSIPDPFRRPDHTFHEWLRREVDARGVRGVILYRHVWCDTWHAERPVLRERVPVAWLDAEVGDDAGSARDRLRTRIEAFLESLQ